MRIAIYTANFDNKDKFRAPKNHEVRSDIDYYYFTDFDADTNCFPYQKIKVNTTLNDITKNARQLKIIQHHILENYDITIWHDTNIRLDISKIDKLIAHSFSSKTFITTFKHPNRNDFYSEAMTCIRVEKDYHFKILKQCMFCFVKGLKAHQGLYSTGILIKNFSFSDKTFLNYWWNHTKTFSRRDQLSLSYAVYKLKEPIGIIEGNIFENDYSKYYLHAHNNYELKNKKLKTNRFKMISFYFVKCLRKLSKIL